jgi:hypothetical protein
MGRILMISHEGIRRRRMEKKSFEKGKFNTKRIRLNLSTSNSETVSLENA